MRKLPLVLLAASVIANVVLLARFSSCSADKTLPPVANTVASPAAHAPENTTANTSLSAAEEASLQHARQLLATSDLPELVARLRAAGFSPMDIRGIVSARLAERYGAARVAATAHLEVVPYWRSSMTFPNNPEAGAEVRRLFREQNQMLKELLGPDARATDDWSQMLHDRQYGYLPPGKIERLTALLDDYQDLQQSVWDGSRGMFTTMAKEKIALIEKEKRADLEALLTPEELEAYDMHTSTTANNLRAQLKAFQPTEEEFQLIYRLTNAATQEDKTMSSHTAGEPLDSPLQRKIRTALGPERAETYRMTTDHDYLQLNHFAEGYNLPQSSIVAAFNTIESVKRRALSASNNNSLSPTTRADQITAILQQAETELKSQLGPDAYSIYREQNANWLKGFEIQAQRLRSQPR